MTGGSCAEVVSRSLNYMQSDFAISEAARFLGHTDDETELRARSANYDLVIFINLLYLFDIIIEWLWLWFRCLTRRRGL